MSNVFFKKGTQNKFNSLTSFTAGAFYLTTDTHRLYYADGTTGAVQVNPGITVVDNVNKLPSSNQIKASDYGQFYYCIAENVLAIYGSEGWVQINSAEDTVVDMRETKTISNDATGIVTVVDALYTSDTTLGNDTITAHVEYEGANGLVPSVTPKYVKATKWHTGVTYYYLDSIDSKYKVQSNPQKANLADYYIQEGYKLTLTAPTYTLSSSIATGTDDKKSVTITLGGNAKTDNTVIFKEGSNVSLSRDNSTGIVSIDASDSATIKSVDCSAAEGEGQYGFKIAVTMNNGDSESDILDPIIKLGTNTDEYNFKDGIITLPVYTKSEVDGKIKDFNAMEYKSTIAIDGAVTKLDSKTEKNGYVYMLSESGTLYIKNNKVVTSVTSGAIAIEATAGDLIVVQGTEGNDGYVSTVELAYVPSGNDHDTTYTFSKTTHGFTVADDAETAVGGLVLTNTDNYITLSDDNDSTKTRTVTLAHKTSYINASTESSATTEHPNTTSSESQDSEGSLNIIVPTVTFDSAGHAVSKDVKTYTITDTHNGLKSFDIDASADKNVATITSVVEDNDGASKSDSFQLKSDNLTVSATAATNSDAAIITMNLAWGEF